MSSPLCTKLLGVGDLVTVIDVCDRVRAVDGKAVIWVRTPPSTENKILK